MAETFWSVSCLMGAVACSALDFQCPAATSSSWSPEALESHPRTCQGAANPRGRETLPVPPLLHPLLQQLQPAVLASRLGSNAGEYFAISWQFTGKTALGGREHSAARKEKKQNGLIWFWQLSNGTWKVCNSTKQPKPCTDHYLPTCSSRMLSACLC